MEYLPFFSRWGAGSLEFGTVDFDAKNVLKMLLFWWGSLIVSLFSTNGGVVQNLLFFINFKRMPNFFFADIAGLFNMELTVLL